ncbi:MAG: hypothetical protein AB2401_11130, partial [Bacillus sp. (in: firmicutes)]
ITGKAPLIHPQTSLHSASNRKSSAYFAGYSIKDLYNSKIEFLIKKLANGEFTFLKSISNRILWE